MNPDMNMNSSAGADMGPEPTPVPTPTTGSTQTSGTASGAAPTQSPASAPSQEMPAGMDTEVMPVQPPAHAMNTGANTEAAPVQPTTQNMNTGMNMGNGMQMGTSNMSPFQMNGPLIIVDVLGIVIGLIALFAMYRATKRLGGRAKEALVYVNAGVLAMILSFAVTLWFLIQNEMTMTSMAIHQGLMLIGMIGFILAARKFFSITGA